MDLGIAGKVVFFTGGSKGMGRIAARMLAGEGCKVAVVASATGHDSNRMQPGGWDLTRHSGKTARLRIADRATGPDNATLS